MPTYGQRPIDVVTDSRGNALRGVKVTLYATSADAQAEVSALGSVSTDVRGRWSFDTTASEVWVRTPDGTVWQVSSTEAAATPDQLADEAAARAAADAGLDARVATLEAGGGGGGATDHGALTGLADDDHPQYHTDVRGDARYYPQWDVDAALAAKAESTHGHAIGDVTGLQTALDGKSGTSHTHAAPTWDSVTGKPTTFTPSAHSHVVGDTTGLQAALDGKAASSHTHGVADLTATGVKDGTKFLRDDNTWAAPAGGTSDHGALTGLADDDHTQYALADGSRGSFAALGHLHPVTDLTATGTRSATTFLRGDNTWAVPAGGGGSSPLGSKFVNVQDHGAVGDGVTNDTAAIQAAITAAGVGGTVYFPHTANSYMTDPLKPLSYQTWEGQHSVRYAWDNTQQGGSILRARATQTAVIYNDNNTTNGVATQASRGVTLRNLGIFGGASGTSRTARGIDFGQMAGPERGWTIEQCQFSFCTTGIAGYMWASQIRGCHFSRNGYGIAPDQGLGGGRINDCMITHNYLYFNVNHAISLSGASESGLATIAFNRVERSGALVTGSATYDPTGAPENTFACGIYISRATCISIIGNSSDANTGPGLCIRAATHGVVNNVQSAGNVWKRDGIGDNTTGVGGQLAGVEVKDTQYVQIRDTITYGDPNDGGAGNPYPYYGFQYEANDWLKFDGSAQLDTNANTTARGIRAVGTANWMCSISDPRQPVLGLPAAATASAPTAGLQQGSAYYDTTLDTIRVWDGAAWDSMGGGGVTDHGALTGLADDDHPQYALADGSRGNVWVINSPTGWGTYTGPPAAGTLIVRY